MVLCGRHHKVGAAASGGHNTDGAVFEDLVEGALPLRQAIDAVEDDATLLLEEEAPSIDNSARFHSVAPFFDGKNAQRQSQGEQ